jgi:hypothetical protein
MTHWVSVDHLRLDSFSAALLMCSKVSDRRMPRRLGTLF